MLREVELPPRITLRRLRCWVKRNTTLPEKDAYELARMLHCHLTDDGDPLWEKIFYGYL